MPNTPFKISVTGDECYRGILSTEVFFMITQFLADSTHGYSWRKCSLSSST